MARVLICPEFDVPDLDDFEFVNLPHPNTNESVVFLIEKTIGLMQIQLVENKINSWVVDETIIKDGNVHIITKYDVTYLLLPLLESFQSKGFCTLDTIFHNNDHLLPLQTLDLHEKLSLFCDIKNEADQQFYRYSLEKVLNWLRTKVDQLAKDMDTLIALEDYLQPNTTHDQKVRLAIKVLGDNLSQKMIDLLVLDYDIKDFGGEKISYFNDEIKHKRPGDENKQPLKKAKAAPKKEVKARNVSGMKKMSSFFKKK